VNRVFSPADASRWKSARLAAAHVGSVRVAVVGHAIPAIVFAWPTRHSYTGQPVVEIHAPGSAPILEAVLADLFAAGVRPASAGEFTLRAFLNGQIDLVQAEAVLGVIDALDARRLTAALRQLAGGISDGIAQLRGGLLDLLADLEAGLDFVEEDIQFVSRNETSHRLATVGEEVDRLLRHSELRTQSTGRVRIVLAGLPNAGKSTLFNALAGRNAALVSDASGTTRDYLCATLVWSSLAIELVDTAGWESATIDHESERAEPVSNISQAAQALRESQWDGADLVLWCSASDQTAAARFCELSVLEQLRGDSRPMLLIRTKADLDLAGNSTELKVSAVDGFGITELVAECVARLARSAGGDNDMIGTTAARCRESLIHCRDSLLRANAALGDGAGDELLAVEIREAVDHLGRILGAVYTDDILDRIFSRFCIGK
jgi:tRNA modification GTPase